MKETAAVTAPSPGRSCSSVAAALVLLALVVAVYHPVVHFGFVNWDDYSYVVNNGAVKQGLSWSAVKWAFTTNFNASYLPLTWLSHMLDCQVFGLRAGGHHLTSVLWHALNALLLFFFLRAATGAGARSFWVAALFAVHPLHVESVAWISERKDVLSTFFWFTGLWAYVRYVQKPSCGRYAAVFGACLLGLLAKPMLVTFPFSLLLLDYWPLKRWPPAGARWAGAVSKRRLWELVREKLPLFLLVPVFSATTLISQTAAGAISTADEIPLAPRLANAVVSLGQYLWRLVAPLNLAAIYPHPGRQIAWGAVLASSLATVVLTAGVLRSARRLPCVAVGWLWFLGTLAPVLGVVQVGVQAWADRYTYVPYVGLFVALVWASGEYLASRPAHRRPAVAAGGCVVLVFGVLAHAQVFTWKDDPSLFGRVVERFPRAFQGHFHLGNYYRAHEQWDDAVASYRAALGAAPDRFDGWTNLGLALQGQGRAADALDALRKACALNPKSAAAAFNLAQMNDSLGRSEEAEAGYRRVLQLNPLEERSLLRLGAMLVERGDTAGARPLLQQLALLCLQGWTVGVSAAQLGPLCVQVELWPEAAALLEKATHDDPGNAAAWSYLGLALQRRRLYGPAVDAYRQAVRLEPRLAGARFNLGGAYLQMGDFADALRAQRELEPIAPEIAAKLLALIRQAQNRQGAGASPGRQ